MIYFINYIFAIVLLFSYALPLIPPSNASILSVLSLATPILFLVNVIFALYWLLGLKKQFVLSVLCLVIGFFVSTPIYNFSNVNKKSNNEISIMNYNVRLFNVYNWIKEPNIPSKIAAFIKTENPDILCLQEYHPTGEKLINYPYKYIKTIHGNATFGQAIFSKYKIINQGSLDFENTTNNGVFIDIVKDRDTIRVYNLHLESLGLKINKENFGEKNSEKLIKRLSNGFKKQEAQVKLIKKHQGKCKYPIIITGDFNNIAYSWAYKNIKQDRKDSFVEAGSGFGKTFEIKNIPIRIDFIFADKVFNINEHKNYTIKYSDHLPIMARIGL